MKLLRHGAPGAEKPGLLDDNGHLRDLSDHVRDIQPSTLSPERLAALAAIDHASLPIVEGSPRLGPPVSGVGKIIAIGLNYEDHARESGMPIPEEPILFFKAITSLSGPNDPIVLPRDSVKTDWEAELAVIIGTRAQYVEEADALDYVAGYAVMNDVSERAYQLEHGGQWVKGKSFDGFAPFGPWLVTRDEIPNPNRLHIWLDVNGRRHQDGTTATMIFHIGFLVSYLSRFMTLMPGDIITTGTPPGVGLGMKPPKFLKPGDTMRLGVEGLGEQTQTVRAWEG